ncbi:acetylornithine aminotransferase apoenzyme [Candidatus Kryptobacter tengchongensis]|uniref:Acetylornithine aminotransferase n=1 Tax=Kryptobacter tengchongensis TaxID=1643429 RepID=A0A656D9R6_KRYT1|nr:aspartate aminotransferase family protein [Candidatus Kryptobacter tengchongensis]CUT02367.1 acetylornithine aminotransferase apoenzyme [Candidatus Kryptobacter tengchongensis]CUU09931.1 acetylornithine aminotransferase apoenzyme [Candidatus Kryptobacter tengchongensis]
MSVFELEKGLFFQTYRRLGVHIKRGEGVYLIDSEGRKYLDMIAGIGVNALGYGNEKVKKAMVDQIEKYIHLSNLFVQEPQIELANLLVQLSGYKKVFFTNSGAEAIETAIKLTRKWGRKFGKVEIIAFSNSFHGRTMGALSLMDKVKYRDGYEPFLPEILIARYNDVEDIEKKVSHKTAGVFLEFIQGEGGIVPADEKFVKKIFELRDEFNFLVVADEIQSGLWRTGKFFAFEHYNVKPDIIALAKPLGGGLPLGAVLGNEKVVDVFTTGAHGSTFGGNPVACSAGYAVIKEIQNGIVDNVKYIGNYLQEKLLMLKEKYRGLVKDVRGIGLMVGVELSVECFDVVNRLIAKGIIVNCTSNNVIRLLPPLIIEKEHVDLFIEKFDEVLNEIKQ